MSFKNHILILRMTRLGHIPPALYSTQLLNENGHPVMVVEFGNAKDSTHFIQNPIPKLRLGCKWLNWTPSFLRAFAIPLVALCRLTLRILFKGKPHLMIAHGLNEQFIALVLNKIFDIPYIVHVHESYDAEDLGKGRINKLLLSLEGPALRKAKMLIFPEATRAEIYSKRYGFHCPVKLVYNCPRLHKKNQEANPRKLLGIPTKHLLMGYWGGIGHTNRIKEGIKALAYVPNVHFLIWGWADKSYMHKLKKAAKAAGVENRVHFLGQINEDKWGWLEACDFSYCIYGTEMLRTRYQATASNKLMESLAAGVPVISSSNPDFKEIVETFDVGVCAKTFTVKSIAIAIRKIAKDTVGRKRQSKNAVKLHNKFFNYESQFKPILENLHVISKSA